MPRSFMIVSCVGEEKIDLRLPHLQRSNVRILFRYHIFFVCTGCATNRPQCSII